jgi:hypothetical protein
MQNSHLHFLTEFEEEAYKKLAVALVFRVQGWP